MARMAPRYILLVVATALSALTLALSRLPDQVRDRDYQWLGVPAIHPAFADLSYILAWLDCTRSGIPEAEICPAAGSPYVYPETFLILSPTGLSARDTLVVAASVFVGFIVALFAYLSALTWKQCCYVLAILCAPPTLLALERCNLDVLVVTLLMFAVLCLSTRRWPTLALSAITLAALLKIYPVAALTAAIGRVRRSQWLAGASACIVGLGMQFRHLGVVARNVPQGYWRRWGYPVIFYKLHDTLEHVGRLDLLPAGIEHSLQIAAPVLCIFLALRIVRRGIGVIAINKDAAGFIAGSSVYCFCWLFGANYDYRLLALLLILPYLFSQPSGILRPYTSICLYAILPMFWLSLWSIHLLGTLIQEALALAVFCSLLTILIVYALQAAQASQILALNNLFTRHRPDVA